MGFFEAVFATAFAASVGVMVGAVGDLVQDKESYYNTVAAFLLGSVVIAVVTHQE